MKKTRILFNTSTKVLLSRSDRKDYRVYIEAIDEKTEENLDKQIKIRGFYKYQTIDKYIVDNNDVLLYGEINLDNKEDINYLDKFKNYILNSWDECNFLYSNFNYEKGEITMDESRGAFIGTNFVANHIKWFKQQYCILGKPKRIIIYKQR